MTTFAGETPVGTCGTNAPVVQVAAFEDPGVDISSADITIDGLHLGTVSVDYPNASLGDFTYAVITADLSAAPVSWDVSHDVEVTVINSLSEPYVDTWSFTPDQPPVVASVIPAASAVSTATARRPLISATLVDPDSSAFTGTLNGANNYFEVDGVAVANASVTFVPSTKTFRYTPAVPLSDHATHTVDFGARDSATAATAHWQFRIDTTWQGTFSHLSPTGSPVTSATAPLDIRVRADDARYAIDTANPNNSMTLDGSKVTTATFSNPVPGDPTILDVTANRVLSDGSHTAITHVVDLQGLPATDTWTFTVASPPSASDFAPNPATTNKQPQISAKVSDNGPGAPTVTMTLDGALVASAFDLATGVVSFTPPVPFADATDHSVGLSMQDSSGNTSTASWTFHVQANAGATFSARVPASGATIASAKPTVSVVATSPINLDAGKTKLLVDAVAVTPVVTQPQATRLNISGTDGTFPDGAHSVTVEVTDVNGFKSTDSWPFSIQAPPTPTAPIPEPNSTSGAARPPIGFWAVDNTPGDLTVTLSVDGGQVTSASVPQGAFWWNPASDLAPGGHTVHASVRDASGNTSTLDWNFQIADLGPMADSRACVNCHMGFAVPNHPSPTLGAPCTNCHTDPSAWPTTPDPWHDDAKVSSKHMSSTSGCSPCHDSSVIAEHSKYPSVSAIKFQCVMCHDSKDARVRAAIASKNPDCTACHDAGAGGHEPLHDGGLAPTDDPSDECTICHSSNVAVQHGDDCSLCHKSSDPNVVAAIAAGNTECSACHSTMHGATLTFFDFQPGNGVTTGAEFRKVFPSTWNVSFAIDNGSGPDASPHGGYSQSTAKCEVCHAVHRAPTLGTAANATIDNGGTGTTSSRYKGSAWTADASTQMLLRSTVANACMYCHVTSGATKMYAGDSSLAIVGDTAFGWGQFYGHTTGCTSCHAVHGANTFKSADRTVDGLVLKYQGVKNLGTIALKVQPEVYGGNGALYDSKADMLSGALSATATASGVTAKAAAITAQCTICHASYAVGEETINATYLNPELFQPASWASANGATTKIWVGNAANPVAVLPGTAGLTYTATDPGNMTGSAGSLIMSYKNHPLKGGGKPFKGAGAGASFVSGNIAVSDTGSSVCQSCHNAPEVATDGGYVYQSFPHYTPGYYKFMAAEDQTAFDTPSSEAEFAMGRQAFFNSGFGTARPGKPAVMNDGYCTKCHTTVGFDY